MSLVLADLEVDLLPGVNSPRLIGVRHAEIRHRLAEVIGHLKRLKKLRDSGYTISYQRGKLCAKYKLCLRAARMRSHGGLAHAQHFKAYIFAFSIAVEPQTNDMRTPGCDEI